MQWGKIPSWVIPLVAFLVVALIGQGALWRWSEHKLETSKHTAKLRHDINEIFFRILELADEHIKTGNDYRFLSYYIESKKENGGSIILTDPEVKEKYLQFIKSKNKFTDQQRRLDFLIDDYEALETELARLEGRQPRALQIDFEPPSPPTAFSISEVLKVHE